jgi:hypothetical protein
MVNPNPTFLLVQKFEISPKGFTLGVKSEIKKITLPQILINAEIYGLVLAPKAGKKGYHQIWEVNFATQKCFNVGPEFFLGALTTSVKRA